MFRIVITEITTETVTRLREWKPQGHTKESETKYGYTPEIQEQKEVPRMRYDQLVDELEIAKVVAVVNRISRVARDGL